MRILDFKNLSPICTHLTILLLMVSWISLHSVSAFASVFGTDARTFVHNDASPWNRLGRVEAHPKGVHPKDRKGAFGICTGALVGPNLIVTNAHCLAYLKNSGTEQFIEQEAFPNLVSQVSSLRSNLQVLSQDVWFRAGLDGKSSWADTRVVKMWFGTRHSSKERERDWALLQLEHPLGEQSGWFDVDPLQPNGITTSDQKKERPSYVFAAYATDFASGHKLALHKGCHISRFSSLYRSFLHDCHMNSGSSGAPILRPTEEGYSIAALNVAHIGKSGVLYKNKYKDELANLAIPVTDLKLVLDSLLMTDNKL